MKRQLLVISKRTFKLSIFNAFNPHCFKSVWLEMDIYCRRYKCQKWYKIVFKISLSAMRYKHRSSIFSVEMNRDSWNFDVLKLLILHSLLLHFDVLRTQFHGSKACKLYDQPILGGRTPLTPPPLNPPLSCTPLSTSLDPLVKVTTARGNGTYVHIWLDYKTCVDYTGYHANIRWTWRREFTV